MSSSSVGEKLCVEELLLCEPFALSRRTLFVQLRLPCLYRPKTPNHPHTRTSRVTSSTLRCLLLLLLSSQQLPLLLSSSITVYPPTPLPSGTAPRFFYLAGAHEQFIPLNFFFYLIFCCLFFLKIL